MTGGFDIATKSRGTCAEAMVRGRDARSWSRTVASGLLLALLLALSFQSYVVGAHHHLRQRALHATTTASFGLEHSPTHGHRGPAAPDHCPICEEIAVAGAYLPAPSLDILAPTPFATWYPEVASRRAVPRQQSHAWRSRGPPSAPTFLT